VRRRRWRLDVAEGTEALRVGLLVTVREAHRLNGLACVGSIDGERTQSFELRDDLVRRLWFQKLRLDVL
jgi:hypothetical protein